MSGAGSAELPLDSLCCVATRPYSVFTRRLLAITDPGFMRAVNDIRPEPSYEGSVIPQSQEKVHWSLGLLEVDMTNSITSQQRLIVPHPGGGYAHLVAVSCL